MLGALALAVIGAAAPSAGPSVFAAGVAAFLFTRGLARWWIVRQAIARRSRTHCCVDVSRADYDSSTPCLGEPRLAIVDAREQRDGWSSPSPALIVFEDRDALVAHVLVHARRCASLAVVASIAVALHAL